MTALTGVCTAASCWGAVGTTCHCLCGGYRHGLGKDIRSEVEVEELALARRQRAEAAAAESLQRAEAFAEALRAERQRAAERVFWQELWQASIPVLDALSREERAASYHQRREAWDQMMATSR